MSLGRWCLVHPDRLCDFGARGCQQADPFFGLQVERLGDPRQRLRVWPPPVILLQRPEHGEADAGSFGSRLLAQASPLAEGPQQRAS